MAVAAVKRILGVDPGSVITGYGIIDFDGVRSIHVDSGCLRLPRTDLPQRLKAIFNGIGSLIRTHGPHEVAIEQVFVSRNPSSAIKLGQARGAAICAAAAEDLTVAEYTAAEVKQAIVGRGRADKVQVQHMVGALLGLRTPLQPDAADALAIALTHAHMAETRRRMGVDLQRRGR